MVGLDFCIDQKVIQIYNNKDVKFLSKDFINIAFKINRSIGESERHNLVLEIAISGLKNIFLFIAFSNSYPIVGTSQV